MGGLQPQGSHTLGPYYLPLPPAVFPKPATHQTLPVLPPRSLLNPSPPLQPTALVLLQRILPFSLPLAEGFDAGANLGYSAVLQTLLQLQLIIHSGCQWPRRQEREGNDRNQENGRDALSALTQQPSDSHGKVKNPHQTPPNTGTDTVATHGHRAIKHQIL